MSETKPSAPEHPILVERELRALAALAANPDPLQRLPVSLGAAAFTSAERRAYFVALSSWDRTGEPPRPPAELAHLPPSDDWWDLWRCCDAAAARALRDAAEQLHRAAAVWLSEPTDAGVCGLNTAVNVAVEQIALAWGEETDTAGHLVNTCDVDASRRAGPVRCLLPAPTGWWEPQVGPIPHGSLVFVRAARVPAAASASVAWALATARQGLPTALWARRVPQARVAEHLLALAADVQINELRQGALADTEWSAVAAAQDGLAALPLVVAGGAHSIRAGELLRMIRRWRHGANRVRVVVVDGAEHLELEPRALFRAARMMDIINHGYLVVVGHEGDPAERYADAVVSYRARA